MTEIESELERFELQQAREVWECMSHDGNVALSEIWRAPKHRLRYGSTTDEYTGEAIRGRSPQYDALVDLGLARREGWYEKGFMDNGYGSHRAPFDFYDSGYVLTEFGAIVARYGEAIMVVNAAKDRLR